MKIYGITIISSKGDILVMKEDGIKDWAESMTKIFLNKQDCIDYAVKQAKISFDAYDFETGETVPEDENGRTWESLLEDLKDGENICIQGCSCHTCYEYFVQELDVYPVVCHYSFDCDTPVTICASGEEAKQILRRDYEEECRIQIEENGYEDECDLAAKISDDGTYAEIFIDAGTGDAPDKIEWSIGTICQKEEWIQTDDFQRLRKIGDRTYELIEANEINGKYLISEADKIKVPSEDNLPSDILSIVHSYYRGGYDEFKKLVPNPDDREQYLAEMIYEQTSVLLNDLEFELLTEAQTELFLDYYTRNGKYPKAGYIYGWHITDIEWNIDKKDFDSEAEYEAVLENVLPEECYLDPGIDIDEIEEEIQNKYEGYCVYAFNKEAVIPRKRTVIDIVWDFDEGDEGSFTELPDHVDIPDNVDNDDVADWLSDKYGWCVESFVIEQ